MNEDFERELQNLAREAQQHPPLSSPRQLALSELLSKIWNSPNLAHPQRQLWSSNLYEDLYNEALQKTMLETCQKIDNYNPKYSVMAWVNFRLDKQFKSVVGDRYKQGVTYISQTEKKTFSFASLDDLERDIPVTETINEAKLLRQFLEEDPENRLRNEHIRGRKDITFQSITIAKFIRDRTWTEIANSYEISVKTLCSFFTRSLQKLMPYFRKYLQE